jgi:hypothetical protein
MSTGNKWPFLLSTKVKIVLEINVKILEIVLEITVSSVAHALQCMGYRGNSDL